MRNVATILVLAVACFGTAALAGTLDISSDVRSDVFLNGRWLGQSPLLIDNIPPGHHELRLIDVETGWRKTEAIHMVSPSENQNLFFDFNRSASQATLSLTRFQEDKFLTPVGLRRVSYLPLAETRVAVETSIPTRIEYRRESRVSRPVLGAEIVEQEQVVERETTRY